MVVVGEVGQLVHVGEKDSWGAARGGSWRVKPSAVAVRACMVNTCTMECGMRPGLLAPHTLYIQLRDPVGPAQRWLLIRLPGEVGLLTNSMLYRDKFSGQLLMSCKMTY